MIDETTRSRLVRSAARWVSAPDDDASLRDLLGLRAHLELFFLSSLHERLGAERPELLRSSGLGCFELIASLPVARVLPVLTHPVATSWSRRARSLLDAGDLGALEAHLDGFAPIAIAAAARGGAELRLPGVKLPRSFSFPDFDARVDLPAPGRVDLAAADGALHVRCRGGEARIDPAGSAPIESTGLLVSRAPFVASMGIAFEVGEPVLRALFPWVDDPAEPDVRTWIARLDRSATLIAAAHRGLFAEITGNLRVIVPVSRRLGTRHSTGSAGEAWRAINTTLVPEPWFSDGIIHEHRHDLLNTLSLLDELFDASTPDAPSLYSPWRPEPRPPVAVFHATYVFVAVAGFYDRLLAMDAPDLDVPRSELLEASGLEAVRLLIAVEDLRAATAGSAFGAALLDEIARESARLHERATRRGAFASGAIARAVQEHHRAWTTSSGLRARVDVEGAVRRWT